jgi:hypothetical protein
MVERDPDFDEAALGFRKFSRFLRQAHDEEVITLERTGEGNYKIASVAGGEVAATPAPRAQETAPEAAEEKSKPRGRRDRKERSGRRGRGSRTSEKAADESETAADAQAPAEAPPAEAPPAEEPPEPEIAAAEPEPSTSPVDDAPAAPADPGFTPTGLTGRRRRSSSRPQPSAGSVVVPGPVDKEDDGGKVSASKDDGGSAVAQPTTPTARTMGRFRKGSRGPGSPGTAEPAAVETAAESTASASGSGGDLTPEQRQLVEKMARGYQGVGRRTAERLVQEFGDRVLEVIDNEPGRIESVLPRGRAQAVIDGRRAEREG